jgi:hypothetical protein
VGSGGAVTRLVRARVDEVESRDLEFDVFFDASPV